MKNYSVLAWRELSAKKLTSFLILTAVILSTMMTAAVGQCAGVLSAMRQQQAIALGGDRYATFVQLSEEKAKALEEDDRLSYTGRSVSLGDTNLNDQLSLGVAEYWDESMAGRPSDFRIVEGRLPQKPMELALPQDALEFLGFQGKVGDKISATYLMGDTGAVASAVEVVEDAAPDDGSSSGASDAGTSSQSSTPAVPASSSSSASSAPAPNSNSASGSSNNAGGNSGNWLQDYANWALGGQGNGNSNNNDSNNDDDDDEEDYTSSSKPTESQPENKPTETTPEPEPEPEPSEDAGDVYEAIRLINAERAKAGLAELTIDDDLMSMAAVRADEMSEKFEHTRPDGSDWKTIFDEFGWTLPNKRGENGSAGDGAASKTVSRWMNSSGHKANILKDNVTKIGVGYYYDGSAKWKHYWTMIVTN